MFERYNIKGLKSAFDSPRLFLLEAHRIMSKPVHWIHSKYFNMKYNNGIDIMSQDWDNLIILDACRYDYFKDQDIINGDLDQVVSKGHKSYYFIKKNFSNRELHDTIYITTNPHFKHINENTFFKTHSLLDYWDSNSGTILPSDVVTESIKIHNKYPNKRLIIHFMQPHRPHIGPTAEKIREKIQLKSFDTNDDMSVDGMWWACKKGEISLDEIRKSYQESLNIALENVKLLLDEINGKSIVTSDHGELLGDRIYPFTNRRYGHQRPQCRQLRMVPWLTVDSEYRRSITEDKPIEENTDDDHTVENRLEALGYK